MLAKLFIAFAHISPAFKKFTWRQLYQYLAGSYKIKDWIFMNYGYLPENPVDAPKLNEEDEGNRYFIQLYHFVATATDVVGKAVLEVGSGRGGGASYIKRYLNAESMTGVDFSENAIKFCRERHKVKELTFQQGDAENLPFGDAAFDVIVNVESSHCYGSFEKFVDEVYRVLKPGGQLVFADLRGKDTSEELPALFTNAGLEIIEHADITKNVLAALDAFNEQKLALMQGMLSSWLRKPFQEFAGVQGSQIYESFKSGSMVYHHYVLQKS